MKFQRNFYKKYWGSGETKMKKKRVTGFLLMLVLTFTLCGCGGTPTITVSTDESYINVNDGHRKGIIFTPEVKGGFLNKLTYTWTTTTGRFLVSRENTSEGILKEETDTQELENTSDDYVLWTPFVNSDSHAGDTAVVTLKVTDSKGNEVFNKEYNIERSSDKTEYRIKDEE